MFARGVQDGVDVCDKIASEISQLPPSGGVVDLRGVNGYQTCSRNPFDGAQKSVELLLGAVTINIEQSWVLPNNLTSREEVSVRGSGTDTTVLEWGGSPGATVIDASSTNGLGLSDLTIDGRSTAGVCVLAGGNDITGTFDHRYVRVAVKACTAVGIDTGSRSPAHALNDAYFEDLFLAFSPVGLDAYLGAYRFVGGRISESENSGIRLNGNSRVMALGTIFSANGADVQVRGRALGFIGYGNWFENSRRSVLEAVAPSSLSSGFQLYGALNLHTSSTASLINGANLNSGTVVLQGVYVPQTSSSSAVILPSTVALSVQNNTGVSLTLESPR